MGAIVANGVVEGRGAVERIEGDGPPFAVPLRVGEDAALALDEMCALGYANTRAGMAAIWIERWSHNPVSWPPSEGDTAPRIKGLASSHHPDAYAHQPVAVMVTLDESPMQVLRSYAAESAVGVEHLASAVIDEHTRHVAADIRRRDAADFVGQARPCWCGQLRYWYTK
jgi:hypothetical protein